MALTAATCSSLTASHVLQTGFLPSRSSSQDLKWTQNTNCRTFPTLTSKKVQKKYAKSANQNAGIFAETQFFSVPEAKKAVEEDKYTVVDIRDGAQFERAHIKDCVHIPLFVENTDMDVATIIKRQAHNSFAGVFYGLKFTKPNVDFLSTFEKKFTKESKILLVCQEGLRSGTAVEKLEDAGFENLASLTSGLQTVPPGTFSTEGSKELKDAGKVGFVMIQTQFSAVLGSLIFLVYLYLQFFPEESSKLLGSLYG